MSSSKSRRQEVTEQMWYAAEDCSRSVQRRLEMLGRRRLRVGYGEWTVHKTKRNADAFDTPTLLDGEVRRRGMTVLGHEDICKPERPACNLSAMELSASVIGVGAAWCGRTLMSVCRSGCHTALYGNARVVDADSQAKPVGRLVWESAAAWWSEEAEDKGKGLDTCYSATYMSQTRDQ